VRPDDNFGDLEKSSWGTAAGEVWEEKKKKMTSGPGFQEMCREGDSQQYEGSDKTRSGAWCDVQDGRACAAEVGPEPMIAVVTVLRRISNVCRCFA
jgi:hypothetical protein